LTHQICHLYLYDIFSSLQFNISSYNAHIVIVAESEMWAVDKREDECGAAKGSEGRVLQISSEISFHVETSTAYDGGNYRLLQTDIRHKVLCGAPEI